MRLSGVVVLFLLALCLIVVPVSAFLIKPVTSKQIKMASLLTPILIFFGVIIYTSSYVDDCIFTQANKCGIVGLFFPMLATLSFVMYVGWVEYIWRRYHRQIFWPLKDNLKYDMASNIIIIISLLVTLAFIGMSLWNTFFSLIFKNN